MHRVSEETPYIRGKEKCPRRVPATSWHSSSLSWSSARFSGYQKHHKLFCMHSTAIAGRYSCCRHQCWGWSSHPQQLANRHGRKVVLEFWFGHPKCHFWYPPKRPKWVILGVFGYFGGTENGTSGARIKILRPLFNTNTPPKPPFRHLGNHFGPPKSDFQPFCTFCWILVIFTGGGIFFWESVWFSIAIPPS